tara:strand:- start:568 stop:1014 length:447 start_codon:yes stop_codon:yes gene_type:complete
MRDLANNINVEVGLVPVLVTADTNCASVDLSDVMSCAFVVNTGIEGVTLSSSVKFEFYLEESDDNSTFTAVTSSKSVTGKAVTSTGIFLTLDANSETPQITTIGYIGGKAFARVRIDATGSHSTGTPMGITNILGNFKDATDAYSVNT